MTIFYILFIFFNLFFLILNMDPGPSDASGPPGTTVSSEKVYEQRKPRKRIGYKGCQHDIARQLSRGSSGESDDSYLGDLITEKLLSRCISRDDDLKDLEEELIPQIPKFDVLLHPDYPLVSEARKKKYKFNEERNHKDIKSNNPQCDKLFQTIVMQHIDIFNAIRYNFSVTSNLRACLIGPKIHDFSKCVNMNPIAMPLLLTHNITHRIYTVNHFFKDTEDIETSPVYIVPEPEMRLTLIEGDIKL